MNPQESIQALQGLMDCTASEENSFLSQPEGSTAPFLALCCWSRWGFIYVGEVKLPLYPLNGPSKFYPKMRNRNMHILDRQTDNSYIKFLTVVPI